MQVAINLIFAVGYLHYLEEEEDNDRSFDYMIVIIAVAMSFFVGIVCLSVACTVCRTNQPTKRQRFDSFLNRMHSNEASDFLFHTDSSGTNNCLI